VCLSPAFTPGETMRRSVSSMLQNRSSFSRIGIRRGSKTATTSQRQVDVGQVMWSPSQQRIRDSRMDAFARLAGERSGRDLRSWPDLHRWSVSEVGEFWQTVSDFCRIKWLDRGTGSAYTPPRPSPEPGVGGTEMGQRGVRDRGQERGGAMTDALWFEGAKL
ncbi:unnamed protein product, partial [Ectocarpus sp. 12 AP-2014]